MKSGLVTGTRSEYVRPKGAGVGAQNPGMMWMVGLKWRKGREMKRGNERLVRKQN